MKSSELTLLKLGGSVITLKDKPLTPNTTAIKRLADEISESRCLPLIIVHGGGSFGHPIAAKYGIVDGFKSREQIIGFSETHNSMIALNMLIVEALINRNIPAFSVSPSSFIVTRRGRICRIYRDVLDQALKLDLIPVLYGDAVFDYDMGFTILSGDQLVSELAIEFDAKKVIVGVDVDGLYTEDPKINPNAQLITDINVSRLKEVLIKIEGSKTIDVTGGMMGKISELINCVMKGIDVLIVNALKPGNIYGALKGEKVVGTKIVKE